MTSIHAVLEQFREAATSNRDLCDKLELLVAKERVAGDFLVDSLAVADMVKKWPNMGATKTRDPGAERKKA